MPAKSFLPKLEQIVRIDAVFNPSGEVLDPWAILAMNSFSGQFCGAGLKPLGYLLGELALKGFLALAESAQIFLHRAGAAG